ncbi:unnamed protein product [Microthlaspi erraticum]|uniref:Uncharacterized protein n=1 Tax=Microthlaspi erraticum TaxID=1685480 RepID=A0A6D2HVB1_9BRAS|nr:unnamed protein product [Microthlaspi erraticum]
MVTCIVISCIRVEFLPHDPNPNGPDGMINSEDEEKIKLFQERIKIGNFNSQARRGRNPLEEETYKTLLERKEAVEQWDDNTSYLEMIRMVQLPSSLENGPMEGAIVMEGYGLVQAAGGMSSRHWLHRGEVSHPEARRCHHQLPSKPINRTLGLISKPHQNQKERERK